MLAADTLMRVRAGVVADREAPCRPSRGIFPPVPPPKNLRLPGAVRRHLNSPSASPPTGLAQGDGGARRAGEAPQGKPRERPQPFMLNPELSSASPHRLRSTLTAECWTLGGANRVSDLNPQDGILDLHKSVSALSPELYPGP